MHSRIPPFFSTNKVKEQYYGTNLQISIERLPIWIIYILVVCKPSSNYFIMTKISTKQFVFFFFFLIIPLSSLSCVNINNKEVLDYISDKPGKEKELWNANLRHNIMYKSMLILLFKGNMFLQIVLVESSFNPFGPLHVNLETYPHVLLVA